MFECRLCLHKQLLKEVRTVYSFSQVSTLVFANIYSFKDGSPKVVKVGSQSGITLTECMKSQHKIKW